MDDEQLVEVRHEAITRLTIRRAQEIANEPTDPWPDLPGYWAGCRALVAGEPAPGRDLSAVVDELLGDDESAVHTVTKVKQTKAGHWKVHFDGLSKFVVLQPDAPVPRVGDQVAVIVQIRPVEAFTFRTDDGRTITVGRPKVYRFAELSEQEKAEWSLGSWAWEPNEAFVGVPNEGEQ